MSGPWTQVFDPIRESVPVALRTACLLAVAVAVACSGPEAGGEAEDVTAFEGARVFVGDGSPLIEEAVFLAEGGRFARVGRRDEVEVPAGARRVDLSGTTVVPGFVNTHMHLPTERDALVEALRHNAYYGAAAVVSLGHDPGDRTAGVRGETIPGAARFLNAGRGITRPEPGRSEVPYWIETAGEGREAIRELAADVDLVKIWVDDRNGQYEKLTPEMYGAVIDEAHRHDLRVAAHIFSLEDAKGLLDAGVDAFAHGVRDGQVDDEFVARMSERQDAFYVPNLPDPGDPREVDWLAGTVPADRLEELREAFSTPSTRAREAYEIQAPNLARLNEAGARIAFGTDGGAPWALHMELEAMVRAGMTPAEALVAATRTSAEMLRLDDQLGTIQPGRSADFVVLEASPLEDITNTRRIRSVYLRGSALDREELGARLREGGGP